MTAADLPAVNASLNATATVLLLLGFFYIKTERKTAHAWTMGAAFLVSCAFLTCYIVHKIALYQATGKTNVPFAGPQPWKTIYLLILGTHVLLSLTVPPLAIVTMRRAWQARYEAHRRLSKITLPIWLYVSVTGVLVYFFLYRWFPQGPKS